MFGHDDKVEGRKDVEVLSGVIPRMLRVMPWRGRVEGKERDDCFCFFLLLSALLNTRLGRLPSRDVNGEACRGGKGCVWDGCR